MSRRALTLIPILLGAIAGGAVALFESYPGSQNPPSASAPAAAQGDVAANAATSTVPPPEVTQSAEPPQTPTPLTVPAASAGAASSATAAVGGAGNAVAGAGHSRTFDLSEPLTEAALTAAQVHCNQKIPEDCERAAVGLESGHAGIKDPPRARSLRRIALTLYVKQCESNRVAACSRLAEMYDVGEIVQVNPKNAKALRVRVRELCAKHPNDPECQVPL